MDNFWIVVQCVRGGFQPVCKGYAKFKKHTTAQAAMAEADRLSKVKPGKVFIVFESQYAALSMLDSTPVDNIKVTAVT